MAKYLEIPTESKFLAPGISLIPEKEDGRRHFEDHNILGKTNLNHLIAQY